MNEQHLQRLQQDLRRQREARVGEFPSTPPGSPLGTQFKVQFLEDNYLGCKTWNGETLGDALVYIALPWTLRRSTYDGVTVNSWTYAYVSQGERHASRMGYSTSTQVIWPAYQFGAVIYAMRVAQPLGIAVGDVKVRWQDLNVDARQWMEVC